MSYTIYYGAMSVKLSKDNKYIPMTLAGANNVRDYDGKRVRNWRSITDRNGKLFFTPDEFMDETKHIIEVTEYLSDNRISGNGNMTPKKLINFSKKCIQNAISFEQAVDMQFFAFWYDTDDYRSLQKFYPKTETELFDFVNAEENKNKTIYFSFFNERDANNMYERVNAARTLFKKKSEGNMYFQGFYSYKTFQERDKNRFYVGKDKNNEPIIVGSPEQAFKFTKDPSVALIIAIFNYLKHNLGYETIYSIGVRTMESDK